jgi:hypothetical protein
MDLDAYRIHFGSLSKGIELTNGHKSKVKNLFPFLSFPFQKSFRIGSIAGLVSGWQWFGVWFC